MHKIFISISTLAYALYIYSFPISFYNDDALFLSNGILNFSVVDFSPHFPGYVSLVFLGKLINIFVNDASQSLFIIGTTSAILLPLIIYLYLKEITNKNVAITSFLFILTSAYLVNFSLSLLSDSMGLFFLFLSLYLIELKKAKTSGVLLSIAIFARPSYFIFYLVGILYLYLQKRDLLKDIFTYFFISSFVFFLLIYATNGSLYFYEAKRFLDGHFNIWGSGQFTQISWLNNIFNIENVVFLLLLFCYKLKKEFYLLYAFFFFYLIWILYGQNPDNIRHMIPLVFIAYIFIANRFATNYALVIFVVLFNVTVHFNYNEKYSPVDQISSTIKNSKKVIITNRNIEILRNKDFIVLDKYYKNHSQYLKSEKEVIFITTTKNEFKKSKKFNGRFIGERAHYLKK